MRDTQAITNWRSSASRLLGSEDQAPSSIKTGTTSYCSRLAFEPLHRERHLGPDTESLEHQSEPVDSMGQCQLPFDRPTWSYLRELLRSTVLDPTKPVRFPLVRDCAMVARVSCGSPIGSLDGHRVTQCRPSRFVVGDGGRDIPRLVWLGPGPPPGTSVRSPSPLCPLPRSCLQLRSLPNIVGPCRRGWCSLGCDQRKVPYSGSSYDRRRFVLSHRLDGSHWPRHWARRGRSTRRKGNRYPAGIMGRSWAVIVGIAAIL